MTTTTDNRSVAGKMSVLDRFLAVWIGIAMVAGLLLGRLIPGLGDALSVIEIDNISLPIALGLLIMMYRCSRRCATTASTPSRAIASC